MPEGVEHVDRLGLLFMPMLVIIPLMPEGVEHKNDRKLGILTSIM